MRATRVTCCNAPKPQISSEPSTTGQAQKLRPKIRKYIDSNGHGYFKLRNEQPPSILPERQVLHQDLHFNYKTANVGNNVGSSAGSFWTLSAFDILMSKSSVLACALAAYGMMDKQPPSNFMAGRMADDVYTRHLAMSVVAHKLVLSAVSKAAPATVIQLLQGQVLLNYPDQTAVDVLIRGVDIHSCSLQELACLLETCADLQHPMKGEWLKQVTEVSVAFRGQDAPPRELAAVLLGLARYQYVPKDDGNTFWADWLMWVLAAGPALELSQLGRIMLAVHHLRLNPGEDWVDCLLALCHPKLYSMKGLWEVKDLLNALARMKYLPDGRWSSSFFAASEQLLVQADPYTLCLIAGPLAKLRLQGSSSWATQLLNSFLAPSPPADISLLSRMLWSLQVLVPTAPSWVPQHSQQLERLVLQAGLLIKDATPAQLVELIVGCANLGFHPGTSFLTWHASACGRFGRSFPDASLYEVFAAYRVLKFVPAPTLRMLMTAARNRVVKQTGMRFPPSQVRIVAPVPGASLLPRQATKAKRS